MLVLNYINSHGPNIYFGTIFLPCKKLWCCISRTAALGAEWISVTQDTCTIAQAKVCEEKTKNTHLNAAL